MPGSGGHSHQPRGEARAAHRSKPASWILTWGLTSPFASARHPHAWNGDGVSTRRLQKALTSIAMRHREKAASVKTWFYLRQPSLSRTAERTGTCLCSVRTRVTTHQVGGDSGGDQSVRPADQGPAEKQHGCGNQNQKEGFRGKTVPSGRASTASATLWAAWCQAWAGLSERRGAGKVARMSGGP